MVKKLNVYGLALYGSNSNSLLSEAAGGGTGESLSFSGGFLSADYYLWEQVAVTTRVQTRKVELGGSSPKNTLTSFLPGIQIVVWKLKFSGQMSLSNNDGKTFGALQIETAF